MAEICSIPNCGKPRHARIYCSKHYRRFLKAGIEGLADLQKTNCKWCGVIFTFDQTKGSKTNFCSKTCKLASYNSTVKTCKVEECTKKATTNRMQLCMKHRTRQYNHGNTSTVLKLAKYPEGSVCKVEDCGRTKLVSNYMCNKHYTMWRLHGDPKGGKYEMKVTKALDHEDGTRTCSQCELRLPISEFHKDKTASGGRRAKCKKCRINLVKDWYQENKGRQAGREKKRRLANVEKYAEKEALRYIKDREKRIGLATEHSHRRKARKLETVVEKGISKKALKKKFGTKCYYCKKEMDFSVGVGRKFNRDMATIEHLIPLARGGEHTWENTVLACRHCNISKNAKSIEEFEEFNKQN
jgi:5-methylcytosine-specific restriction endonuclease McrA